MVEPGSDEWNELPPREKAAQLEQASVEARRTGNDQLACAYAIQSLNLYRGHDDRPSQARVLLRLVSLAGWADFGDGQSIFERIHSLAGEAFGIYEELGDRGGMALAGLSLAVNEPPEQAIPRLEACVATLRELGKPTDLAWGLNRLAARLNLSKQKRRARELLEESLALYRSADDRNGIATALFSLAISASEEEAVGMLEESLSLRRKLGQRKRMAELLMMLGGHHRSAERWDAAESCYREGLEVCREIDIPIWQASCMDSLAVVARARGDEETALDWEARSREIYFRYLLRGRLPPATFCRPSGAE